VEPVRKTFVIHNDQDREAAFLEMEQTVHSGISIDASLVPAPENLQCDFDSARPVVWMYPARDFTGYAMVEHDPGGNINHSHNSRGDWAACHACHALIESGDIAGLKARMIAAFGLEDEPLIQEIIFTQLDGFWANRTGLPVRVK